MHVFYKLSVFIHILSAIFWIGGMLFTVVILVPTLRNQALSSKKGLFFTVMGEKFSKISWILFFVLLLTGYGQLLIRGFTNTELFSKVFWQSHFGNTLGYKLILFSIIIIISGLHDFWLGPKTAVLIDTKEADEKTKMFRKLTSWVGRLNLLLGLAILYFAISLVRG